MPVDNDFSALAKAFQTAAEKHAGNAQSTDLLLARYNFLMRHAASDDNQRRMLTGDLFDSAMILAKGCLHADYSEYYGHEGERARLGSEALKKVVEILISPDTAKLLPQHAEKSLFEATNHVHEEHDRISAMKIGNFKSYSDAQKDRELFQHSAADIAETLLTAIDKVSNVMTALNKPVIMATATETKAAPAVVFKTPSSKSTGAP